MSIEFETAKGIENAPFAKKIRREVFVSEQGFVNEFDNIDSEAYHIVAFVDGEQAAAARLFEEDRGWHIGRVAVLKKFRGMGLGAQIMKKAEEFARENKISKISLSAQKRVQGFYEKLGYKAQGDIYYDEFCPHIMMTKEL